MNEHDKAKTGTTLAGRPEFALLCLDKLDNLKQEEKLELLDDAIHRLKFERRLAALSETQLQHMNDMGLSNMQRQRLDGCKTDDERDSVLTEFARAMYFRECMWVDYLNGVTDEPPVAA